jgi:hypothetical protein
MAAVARGTDAAITMTKGADDVTKYQMKLQGISDIFASNDELFKQTMDSRFFVDNLNKADPKDLKEILKGVNDTNRLAEIGKKLDAEQFVKTFKGTDDAQLAKIGKKLDSVTLTKIKQADPALGKKLDPSFVQQAKNAATAFSKASTAKLKQASKSIRKFMSGAENPPNNIDDVRRVSRKMEAAPANQADDLAKETVGKVDDAGEAIENTTRVLEDGSKSSNTLRKGLAELGITPGSVAIGAGVIVLLCMAYDTDNPFTAVDRALDDTGKVVKGFKEVADSAATAVKDTAKGGFDFISFVTQNSWISFACSILCVILLFALFMTGMLGSMGGNNRR